jgi:hypothetical protein
MRMEFSGYIQATKQSWMSKDVVGSAAGSRIPSF